MNRLYFGDNLKWLSDRKEFPDASIDLVYLDPPFNSNADYNVLFREPSGQVSQAQFHAFTDTWSWADAADTYHQFMDTCPNVAVVELMEALHSFLKHSPILPGPKGGWREDMMDFTGVPGTLIKEGVICGGASMRSVPFVRLSGDSRSRI